MEESTILRESVWMVPALVFGVVILVGVVATLIVFIWKESIRQVMDFAIATKNELLERLESQDAAQSEQTATLKEINEALRGEIHTIRGSQQAHELRLAEHALRLKSLEDRR